MMHPHVRDARDRVLRMFQHRLHTAFVAMHGQHGDAAAFPATHHVGAAPEHATDRARHAANAGIASGAAEGIVVGSERIDVEQHQREQPRLAPRQMPLTHQQFVEPRTR